jgi:hypothetical protein
MKQEDICVSIAVIDYLSEGIEWTCDKEIMKRIKATSTNNLKIIAENNSDLSVLAKVELTYRRAHNNIHEEGNPLLSESYKPFLTSSKNLTDSDCVEKWIAESLISNDSKFADKSNKERIEIALGGYYSESINRKISDLRNHKIVSIITEANEHNLIRFFCESIPDIIDRPVLEVKELWTSFIYDLTEATITLGSTSKVKCIKPWASIKVGEVFTGIWKQSHPSYLLRLDLSKWPPGATHPSIFYDKKNDKIQTTKNFEVL